MAESKKSDIKLSENRKSARYRIVEIRIKEAEKKNAKSEAPAPVDTANKKKAAIISSNVNRNNRNKHKYTRTKSDTTTTSDNSDKYKELAKYKMVSQHNKTADKRITSSSTNISASQVNTTATQTNAVNNKSVTEEKSINIVLRAPTHNSYSDNHSDELRRAKAAAIADRLEKTIAEESHNQAKKSFVINRVKVNLKAIEYKRNNISPETRAKFDKAVTKTVQAAISSDDDYWKANIDALKHYKKQIKIEKKIQMLKGKQDKSERKAEKRGKIISNAETAYRYLSAPDKIGENIAKDIVSKTKIGKRIVKEVENVSYIDSKAEANNLADATVGAVTAVPEKIVKDKVKSTVTNVVSGRSRAEKLEKEVKKAEKKYGAEEAKRKRAERNANMAKEAAIQKSKVQFYKESKGLVKSSSVVTNASREIEKVIKQVTAKAVKVAVEEGGKAALVAVAPILIVVLMIIIIIALLFTWIIPHEETSYNVEDNYWEVVSLESDEEILKGYIKHVQDYIDKKQLEILEVVDINYGGFTPDQYNYEKIEKKNGGTAVKEAASWNADHTYYKVCQDITYKVLTGYETEYVYNPITGERHEVITDTPIWGEEQTITSEERHYTFDKRYYKYDSKLGKEVSTTVDEAEFERLYNGSGWLDITEYWHSKGLTNIQCENGRIAPAQDITDWKIKLYDGDNCIYTGAVFDYLMANTEILIANAEIEYVFLPEGAEIVDDSNFSIKEIKSSGMDKDEEFEQPYYVWNLYEYGNPWIKLTDDCDYEHIVAMAAIKKWQEIEADGFDANTYSFEITESDLEYCIDSLFEFYYSYKVGVCRDHNCYKEKVGQSYVYKCNRAGTHKHLIGQVTNLQLIGGVDYALNKVLKMPVQTDYATIDEYEKAMSKFETDKDIYDVYVEYIYQRLGTNTKIPDYENSKEAQERLLRMHQASFSKKPDNAPSNVRCTVRLETESKTEYWNNDETLPYKRTYELSILDISWDAPEPEEYSKGKFVEITGYNVYKYDRGTGKRSLLTTTGAGETSCTVIFDRGGYNQEYIYEDDNVTLKELIEHRNPNASTYIIVEAYNSAGKSPQTKPLFVQVTS